MARQGGAVRAGRAVAAVLGALAFVLATASLASAGSMADNDGDGYSQATGDCNDADPGSHPGAFDIPGDTIDQNCDTNDAMRAQTEITKSPKRKTTKRRPRFEFGAIPGDYTPVTFECLLDGTEVVPCESPLKLPKQAYGKHTFEVWAIDNAGYEDLTREERRFKVIRRR